MRDDDDEEDPKKPRPSWGGRKSDSATEDQDPGPDEVGPDGKSHERYHYMHVRC